MRVGSKAVFGLFLGWLLLGVGPVMAQPILDIVVDDETTGTAPFDTFGNCATHTPGDDCSDTNEYVRTLDTITYSFDYSVNPAGETANDVTITATLPLDAGGQPFIVWETLPINCVSGGISNGGRTLTCNLGTVAGGTTSAIKPAARVLGSAQNNEPIALNATISASNATSVTSNTVNNLVSAAPKLDVSKDHRPTLIPATGPGGQDGLAIIYGLTIEIGDGKGHEVVTENLVITDDLSAHAPNAIPYTFDSNPACGPNGSGRSLNRLPYGAVGIAGGSTSANSVVDSGTWTCTQAGWRTDYHHHQRG